MKGILICFKAMLRGKAVISLDLGELPPMVKQNETNS